MTNFKELFEASATYKFKIDPKSKLSKNPKQAKKDVNLEFGDNSILDISIDGEYTTIKFDKMGNEQKDEIQKFLDI